MNSETTIIEQLDLDRFFSDRGCQYDLLEGTAANPAGTRVIYLSSDVVTGIHAALVEEAGAAWRLILKNCGSLWGRKVAKNLDRELETLFRTSQATLPVKEFIRMAENYFSAHGWGKMEFDLSAAVDQGYIVARLKNSLFTDVIDDSEGMLDSIIAGILRSLFEHLAGRELDAIQIGCPRRGDGEVCVFVISAPERIAELEDSVEAGKSPDQVIKQIAAA